MKKTIYTEKDLSLLPIGFQFFLELSESKNNNKTRIRPKFTKIEKYGTSMYQGRNFYKPISKIFLL